MNNKSIRADHSTGGEVTLSLMRVALPPINYTGILRTEFNDQANCMEFTKLFYLYVLYVTDSPVHQLLNLRSWILICVTVNKINSDSKDLCLDYQTLSTRAVVCQT